MSAPVVMLHSGGMSGRQWRRLAEALSPRYSVLTPDFLGCGANPPWPDDQPFHFEMDVERVERLLPAHLIGHSYGGLIALTVARRHPGQVLSLAVYDPVAFGLLFDAEDSVGLADLSRVSLLDDVKGGTEEWMTEFVNYWNGPGSWQALPGASRESFLRVGRKVYYEVRSLSADRTGRPDYAGLSMPLLLVHGQKSPPAAVRVVKLLAETLPHAQLRVLQGAGHMGPLTHGAELQALVEAHLERPA